MANSNSKAIILEKKMESLRNEALQSMYPGAESNCYLKFRKLLFYPLNYQGIVFHRCKYLAKR